MEREKTAAQTTAEHRGYYLSPAVHKDVVVFISEDDLWRVSLSGGQPTRLTAGLGQVWRPRISPDGEWVAYSASEEGMRDVYIMALKGGKSRRLTYMGDCSVVSFSPSGQSVVFSTSRTRFHGSQAEELFVVPVTGGQPQPLGVGWSSYLSYGPLPCNHCLLLNHPCAKQTIERMSAKIQASKAIPSLFKTPQSNEANAAADEGLRQNTKGETVIAPQGADLEEWPQLGQAFNGKDESAMSCAELCERYDGQGCVFDELYEPFGEFKGNASLPSQFSTLVGKRFIHPTLLGRNIGDISKWKRYRGGLVGQLWIDLDGVMSYEPLIQIDGNIGMFSWIGDGVIVFASDAAEFYKDSPDTQSSNLFMLVIDRSEQSKRMSAEQRVAQRTGSVRRITSFSEYVRQPSASWVPTSDGSYPIVFTVAGDLYHINVAPDGSQFTEPKLIEVAWTSGRQQRQRRLLDVTSQISHFALSQNASQIAYIARGRPFVQSASGLSPAIQLGQKQGVRYSEMDFLVSGDLVVASDELGEVGLEVFNTKDQLSLRSHHVQSGLRHMSVGRIISLKASPTRNMIAFINHRYQLIVVDLDGVRTVCSVNARFDHGIGDIAWSPDGVWLAFTYQSPRDINVIKVMRVLESTQSNNNNDNNNENLEVCGWRTVTTPLRSDRSPVWDPDGKFLYLLSTRDFIPRNDDVVQRAMMFLGMSRPCLIPLSVNQQSPFTPNALNSKQTRQVITQVQDSAIPDWMTSEVSIDFSDVEQRLLAFPVTPGNYYNLIALPGGRVFYLRVSEEAGNTMLISYDLMTQSQTILANNVMGVEVNPRFDNVLVYLQSAQFPVCLFSATYRGPLSSEVLHCPDPSGATLEVQPLQEWRQIFIDAWRYARDNYWTAGMNGIDWAKVKSKYLSLVDRIGSRSELTDLIEQMQGELATSHAYHTNYAHRSSPNQAGIGRLGIDVEWDTAFSGYKITHLYKGDLWSSDGGPLSRPGINVAEGDVIQKVNGVGAIEAVSLDEMLLGKLGAQVELTILKFAVVDVTSPGSPLPTFARSPLAPYTISVEPIADESALRYRDWVNSNREFVSSSTSGRVGYVHIPDMMDSGFSEFHRGFTTEMSRDAVIIDVRYNGGGYVSDMLLDKISRKTLGYTKSRWNIPSKFPPYSTSGPKIALVNGLCGSDCDIFAQNFCKRMAFPVPCMHSSPSEVDSQCKLLGERTWGGVVGIESKTSQPEYAHYFVGREWKVEGEGVLPDIHVPYTPNDFVVMYALGSFIDPHLRAALMYIEEQIGSGSKYDSQLKQCVPNLNLGERWREGSSSATKALEENDEPIPYSEDNADEEGKTQVEIENGEQIEDENFQNVANLNLSADGQEEAVVVVEDDQANGSNLTSDGDAAWREQSDQVEQDGFDGVDELANVVSSLES
eukprot:c19413_g1_i2.p1 GENE.c19413_g1_i2~~c19413_g1_i2.p1  ORF type:complete len:1617 (-),score=405.07 c19413_g1_i2:164-4387(-)